MALRFEKASFEECLARDPLRDFYIKWDHIFEEDAVDLEQALAAAQHEREMQAHLESNPFLLIQHLSGGHGRYVIPQQRLGSEYVTDFLIAHRDSNGFHWIAVEIESPRAPRARQTGEPSAELNHAIGQVQDWRRWLTDHVAYARSELRLTDIDGTLPGLVIMGRRGDGIDPRRLNQILNQNGIEVHSYDWLVDVMRARLAGPWFADPIARPDMTKLIFRHYRNARAVSHE